MRDLLPKRFHLILIRRGEVEGLPHVYRNRRGGSLMLRTSNKTGPTGREILAQGFGRRPMPWVMEERIINAA
jgi:hypothetical protein